MKVIRLIGAVVCFLIAAGQLVGIFQVAAGLLSGSGESTAYLVGRLVGHLFIGILLALIGVRLARPKAAKRATV